MARYSFENLPSTLIGTAAQPSLNLIICIPSYNEEDIDTTIQSLLDCDPVDAHTEVVILINQPEDCSDVVATNNLKTYQTSLKIGHGNATDNVQIYPIYVSDIPVKKAGVGFARKLAMDEAYSRFKSISKLKGGIVCLDADTTVAKNYLAVLHRFFDGTRTHEACSIAFEHVLNKEDVAINQAIIQYEIHLRYFINIQRLINLPFAYQTVGSAMAVVADSYAKLGGMNTRKAGEDFYFLHKFIKNNLVTDVMDTCVYPSPRISDRVPFGTGKAVGEIVEKTEDYLTYNPKSFLIIESFLKHLPIIYHSEVTSLSGIPDLDTTLRAYFEEQDLISKIQELKNNTTDYASFNKRFFRWFDAFRLMKCLHYLRDKSYPNVRINEAITFLFPKLGLAIADELEDNLIELRKYDRNTIYEPKAY